MTKLSVLPFQQIILGTTKRIEKGKDLTELKTKYQGTYNLKDITDSEVYTISNIESEIKVCESCVGECKKKINKYVVPQIQSCSGVLQISFAPCRAGLQRLVRAQSRRAQVPPKYVGKTFADYKITADNAKAVKGAKWLIQRLQHARDTPQDVPTGLYLFGATGAGKTLLAALIATEYIRLFKSVIFGDVPSLLADLKATFDKGGTDELLQRYCDCDLLVLDDLGAGKITDWNVTVLYQIINARYNNERTTIVTSNYDLGGLEKILSRQDSITGKRIVSRLSEMTVPVCLGTSDRRR